MKTFDSTKANDCREKPFSFLSINSEHKYLPFLGYLTLLSLLPAFLYSCMDPDHQLKTSNNPEPIMMSISALQECVISTLDIFVFQDDALQRLECYQRVDDPESWNGHILSCSGYKNIAILANSSVNMDEWKSIYSKSSLESMFIDIESEKQRYPVMYNEFKANAGTSINITLSPLKSEIILRSISCDFTGRPYDGERLSDAKVYLTNVNAQCQIAIRDPVFPTRIINAGQLDEDDMKGFLEPEIMVRSLEEDIGKLRIYPDIRLSCYANNCLEDKPGSPFTRLVIEGKIGEDTYYWPLDINRDNDGNGISRNCRYTFDITITRKGSTDPDIPICLEDAEIKFETEQWIETEDCVTSF